MLMNCKSCLEMFEVDSVGLRSKLKRKFEKSLLSPCLKAESRHQFLAQ